MSTGTRVHCRRPVGPGHPASPFSRSRGVGLPSCTARIEHQRPGNGSNAEAGRKPWWEELTREARPQALPRMESTPMHSKRPWREAVPTLGLDQGEHQPSPCWGPRASGRGRRRTTTEEQRGPFPWWVPVQEARAIFSTYGRNNRLLPQAVATVSPRGSPELQGDRCSVSVPGRVESTGTALLWETKHWNVEGFPCSLRTRPGRPHLHIARGSFCTDDVHSPTFPPRDT